VRCSSGSEASVGGTAPRPKRRTTSRMPRADRALPNFK
jgi:hypothetical protein